MGNRYGSDRNFNPHSHEGSDGFFQMPYKDLKNFNPHSHEGSDVFIIHKRWGDLWISIHTPTKGATRNNRNVCISIFISIHTPTKGATQCRTRSTVGMLEFQSTLPRRERRYSDDWEKYSLCISIHTPTKGATNGLGMDIYTYNISIHTPTKGATALRR